jgi:iron(II)-dependent oxidoreductase
LKFTSVHSAKASLRDALILCRQKTLEMVTQLDDETYSHQSHPAFSPIGWHLGHIAYVEAFWILDRFAGLPTPFNPDYQKFFDAEGLPKDQRQNLPSLPTVLDYLETVRTQVLAYLDNADWERQERFWHWLVQHESQHSEIATFILQLHRLRQNQLYPNFSNLVPPLLGGARGDSSISTPDEIEIPAGECYLGSNTINAQDNERPYHRVELHTYTIDRYPVTCGQYREFMEAGGYQNQEWWSTAGWQWLQQNPVKQPLYWVDSPDWENHPVCGVSYYEAEAYSNFVGKRLPTQAEWEKAASWDADQNRKRIYPWGDDFPTARLCNHNCQVGHTTPVNAYPAGQSAYGCEDMLGNVWEWTSSWFAGYEGFKSYPYQGYSQVFFDNQHRVLMGGSWATRPWALRGSFRNWYHPWVRQILAGFRCARSG